ncbi:MAG: ABC transporter permease [Firmicutes bacterium]|nr:ABC transporter permease [Bacillota bacterium]
MKTVFLVLQRLKQYCKQDKWIFILFVIGAIINSVMVCYLYGNFIPSISRRNSSNIHMYREYQFSFDPNAESSKEDKEVLNSLIDTDLFESLLQGLYLPENRGYALSTVYYGDYPLVILNGENRSVVDKEIIVPKIGFDYSVDDKINIDGKEFSVIGIHGSTEFFISKSAFEEIRDNHKNDCPYFVTAVSKERYIENDDAVIRAFEAIIPDQHFERPIGDAFDRSDTFFASMQIIISFTISSVSFLFLFRFLLDSGQKENAVSRIVGAKRNTISAMVFLEGILLTSAGTAVGIILHKILTPVLFSKLNVIEGIQYNITDYLSIFIIVLMLSIIIILLFTIAFTNRSFIKARGRKD